MFKNLLTRYRLSSLCLLAFFATCSYNSNQDQLEKEGFLPKNDISIGVGEGNGYSKERFDTVLRVLEEVYTPIVKRWGGQFEVRNNWVDGTFNAYAWIEGEKYIVEFPGGLARYRGMTEDAFILIACHEVGHLVGGAPSQEDLTYEGQADYYATLKCMRKLLPHLVEAVGFEHEIWSYENCGQVFYKDPEKANICVRSLSAGKVVGTLFAFFEESPTPQFDTPDSTRVNQTNVSHPWAQCRLDTFVAGALCPVHHRFLTDSLDSRKGVCNEDEWEWGFRPRCWYNPSF